MVGGGGHDNDDGSGSTTTGAMSDMALDGAFVNELGEGDGTAGFGERVGRDIEAMQLIDMLGLEEDDWFTPGEF